MEAKRGAAVSESELNKASKGLHATKGTREHSDSLEYDPQVAEKLQALYEKVDGDIKAVFEVRGDWPWMLGLQLERLTCASRNWTRTLAKRSSIRRRRPPSSARNTRRASTRWPRPSELLSRSRCIACVVGSYRTNTHRVHPCSGGANYRQVVSL
jgi:hypothetical protein